MYFKCTSVSMHKRHLLAVAWKSTIRLKSNCATSIYQTSCFYGMYCDYFAFLPDQEWMRWIPKTFTQGHMEYFVDELKMLYICHTLILGNQTLNAYDSLHGIKIEPRCWFSFQPSLHSKNAQNYKHKNLTQEHQQALNWRSKDWPPNIKCVFWFLNYQASYSLEQPHQGCSRVSITGVFQDVIGQSAR